MIHSLTKPFRLRTRTRERRTSNAILLLLPRVAFFLSSPICINRTLHSGACVVWCVVRGGLEFFMPFFLVIFFFLSAFPSPHSTRLRARTFDDTSMNDVSSARRCTV